MQELISPASCYINRGSFPLMHTLISSGWNWDFIYDWTILKYQRAGTSGTSDRPAVNDTMSSARPALADTVDLSQSRMRA